MTQDMINEGLPPDDQGTSTEDVYEEIRIAAPGIRWVSTYLMTTKYLMRLAGMHNRPTLNIAICISHYGEPNE
jgi:hypothetical protein